VNGHDVDGLAIQDVKGHIGAVVVNGHTPTGQDQVALGSKSMRSLGLRYPEVDENKRKLLQRLGQNGKRSSMEAPNSSGADFELPA